MTNLETKIEAILFFKNEPVSISELSKLLAEPKEKIQETVTGLQNFYKDRGIVVVFDGELLSLGTHPEMSEFIEKLKKEELSRELGRAGLETLAIILYKGPISRREIDHIRGVNSGFVIRSLMIRGLIERMEQSMSRDGSGLAGRSYSYKGTVKLLEYLGVTRQEDLPEYEDAFKKIEEFVVNSETEKTESNE